MNPQLETNNYLLLNGVFANTEQLESYKNCVHDPYMGNGTRYKRFSQYKAVPNNDEWQLELLPPRAYTAPKKYNKIGGGFYRHYEPIQAEFSALIINLITQLDLEATCSWQLNVHQNRSIATSELKGLLTPEGRHTDGHEFVSISVFSRSNIKGGVTRIWETENSLNSIFEREMQSGETILLYDSKVLHDVTDIELQENSIAGSRDILIVAYSKWSDRWYGDEHDNMALDKSGI